MKKSFLLIGEGDFSFAASLISGCEFYNDIHSEVKIIATCYHSNSLKFTAVKQKNIDFITSQGGTVLTDVDATKLHEHPRIKELSLSQIRFNFPHVDKKMNIKLNRNLMAEFFQSCSKLLIATQQEEVEIVVALCAGQGGTLADGPFLRRWDDSWKIVQYAAEFGFLLRDASPFFPEAYTKYTSTGYRKQEKSFRLDGAVVHTFTLGRFIDVDRFHPDASILSSLRLCESRSFLIPKFFAQRITRYRSQLKEIFSAVIQQMLTCLEDSNFVVCRNENVSLYLESKVDRTNEGYIQIYPEHTNSVTAESENSNFYHLTQTLIDNCTFDDLELDFCRMTTGMVFEAEPINEQFDAVQMHMVLHHSSLDDAKSDRFIEAVIKMVHQVINVDVNIQLDFEIVESRKIDYTWFRYLNKLKSEFSSVKTVPIFSNCNTIGSYFKCANCSTMNSVVFVCLDINALLRTKFGIRDSSLLWSPAINLLDYIDENRENVFKPPVLYPLETPHDISFWCFLETQPFNEINFGLFLKNFIGDCLKEVLLLEEYRENANSEGVSCSAQRVSRCYRLTYRSCDFVLSKTMTNDIQTNLRVFLGKYPSITIR